MNVKQMRTNLERTIDDTMSPVDALDLFNAALRELATIARIAAKQVLPIPTDPLVTSVALPTNMVELRKVKFIFSATGKEYTLNDIADIYKLSVYEGQTIEWTAAVADPLNNQPGQIVIEYYRMPAQLTGDDSIPEIPDMFHDAIVFHAAREFFQADDELQLANAQDVKYLRLRGQFDDFTKTRAFSPSPRMSDARPPWARR